MSPSPPGRSTVLDRVYEGLDLVEGQLLDAVDAPTGLVSGDEWRAVGDWLLLAKRVHAERMFFVNHDPVLVFSQLPADASPADIVDLYRRTWCLARPRCLFLAVGDDLHVYALTEPPGRREAGGSSQPIKPLQVLEAAADVSEVLSAFRRDRLESGAAFEIPAFSHRDRGAEQQLLRDVGLAADALVGSGLSRRTAHTLIERAILVRYLEDREVLVPGYFDELAAPDPEWRELLATHQAPLVGPDSRFVTCLQDRALSVALFARLASEFNGDLFVDQDDELAQITGQQLRLLRDLLRGKIGVIDEPLFLWAYDFSVVPTSLISTMYELFHRQEVEGEETNTYYTPPQLVEFMLAGLLTEEVMDGEPRICDPACGSGVFLVEAFRRLVRHDMAKVQAPLSSRRLRELLLSRVVGVDIDEAAVRLAAFSLYLALLNYQQPKDIRQAGPLPRLIADPTIVGDRRPLTVGDAFSSVGSDEVQAPEWNVGGFDVVVANPPWTEPSGGPRSQAEKWVRERGLPTGDRSPSSLFLWRALDLLTEDGTAALLIGAKSLLNTRSTAQAFRRRWLEEARLEHVVSFIDVRSEFFKGARAPFTLLRFGRGPEVDSGRLVIYEAARSTPGPSGSMSFLRLDRRLVPQASLHTHDFLWKTYAVGGHRDEALVLRLGAEDSLGELENPQAPPQFGWQKPSKDDRVAPPSELLRNASSIKRITAWGPILNEWLTQVPPLVTREPRAEVFSGRRLVIGMGVVKIDIRRRLGVQARILTDPLAFPHSMLGFPMAHRPAWQADVALGVLLSSLGQYWLAMVSGGWGVWRDQIRKEQLMRLPVRLTGERDPAVQRIRAAIAELPFASPANPGANESLWAQQPTIRGDLETILAELDLAVADLFGLTHAERDLVDDFWDSRRVEGMSPVAGEIDAYVDAFLSVWNPQLGDDGEFGCEIHADAESRTIAVVFETRARSEALASEVICTSGDDWSHALRRIGVGLTNERTTSLRSHGMLRAVTDTAIVIVKRDEKRLWTRSSARDDAEATTVQAMMLEQS